MQERIQAGDVGVSLVDTQRGPGVRPQYQQGGPAWWMKSPLRPPFHRSPPTSALGSRLSNASSRLYPIHTVVCSPRFHFLPMTSPAGTTCASGLCRKGCVQLAVRTRQPVDMRRGILGRLFDDHAQAWEVDHRGILAQRCVSGVR